MQSRHLMRSQSICTRCGQSLILLYGCLGVGGWSQFSVVFAWSSSVCSIFTSPVLAGDNAPLSMMSNRWSTMPTHFLTREQELPLPDDRAFLDRMPGSKVPVIHQQWQKGDMLPYWALTRFSGHHLYDLEADAVGGTAQQIEHLARDATGRNQMRVEQRKVRRFAVRLSVETRRGQWPISKPLSVRTPDNKKSGPPFPETAHSLERR
mgnify:CR=1 FL=1